MLKEALESDRDRITVLRFEKLLLKFLKMKYAPRPVLKYLLNCARRDRAIEVPPMKKYHRLLLHRVAERFKIDKSSGMEDADVS